MTKTEAIKAAYEDVGLPFIENVIFDNGWLKIKPTQYSSKYKDCDLLKLTTYVHSIRPKSLSGLENNRGWIEFQGNHPKESKWYWIKTNNDMLVAYWASHKNIFVDNDNSLYFNAVTHYQPIETPKPPIF